MNGRGCGNLEDGVKVGDGVFVACAGGADDCKSDFGQKSFQVVAPQAQ